jgi:GntR family transcriptional regulator, transcriptional repressor for pyruvate dehydrogenase complex
MEPAATALAAQRMPDADVAGLQHLLDELSAAPTVEALVANDLEFHRRIGAGAGDTVLCSLIDGLSGPTTRARIWRGLTQQGSSLWWPSWPSSRREPASSSASSSAASSTRS